MNTNLYICQLTTEQQNEIKDVTIQYLVQNEINSTEIDEILANVMSGRIKDLDYDIINQLKTI